MNNRRIFSLVLNVAAVAAPTAALYARYGLDTRIQRDDVALLLPMGAAMFASFLIGTISAKTLHSTAESVSAIFHQLMQQVHHHGTNFKGRAA